MIKHTQQERIIGTYAKLLISDWKTFADLIRKHSTYVSEAAQENKQDKNEAVEKSLSEKQIIDALTGPLQPFFKQKLTALSHIAKFRLELSLRENEAFQAQRKQSDVEQSIPKKLLDKVSLNDLNNMQQELDRITKKHYHEWQEHLGSWKSLLLKKLDALGHHLSIIEIKEFQDEEPLSELHNRFTDLNLELPKLKKGEMNYQQYLTLKADLIIQSCLSRQHKPHEQVDINKILKDLKAEFESVNKDEQQLIKSQQDETTKIIQKLKY